MGGQQWELWFTLAMQDIGFSEVTSICFPLGRGHIGFYVSMPAGEDPGAQDKPKLEAFALEAALLRTVGKPVSVTAPRSVYAMVVDVEDGTDLAMMLFFKIMCVAAGLLYVSSLVAKRCRSRSGRLLGLLRCADAEVGDEVVKQV